MSLRWKFWKRSKHEATEPAMAPVPAPSLPSAPWFPLTSSKELLGLQRIIGNQAVLQLLAPRIKQSAPEAVNKLPRQSFWRKLRRH